MASDMDEGRLLFEVERGSGENHICSDGQKLDEAIWSSRLA